MPWATEERRASLGRNQPVLDLDGDQDLYVTTDTTLNLLFENLGEWRFRAVSLVSGSALSQSGMEQAGMGIDVGDVNEDGRIDLFVSNFSDDLHEDDQSIMVAGSSQIMRLEFMEGTPVALPPLGFPKFAFIGLFLGVAIGSP